MSPLGKIALIFVGAGCGGNLRYWLGGWVASRLQPGLPWGTLAVNLTGCFLIGLVAGVLAAAEMQEGWRLFVIVGLLGGYTTFSAFSLETVNLISEKSYFMAMANVTSSCFVGFLATWLGLVLSRSFG